jgi:hypothetical protein
MRWYLFPKNSSFVRNVGLREVNRIQCRLIHRAKYCLLCGTQLRSFCRSCGEPLGFFKHRFCPNCETSY